MGISINGPSGIDTAGLIDQLVNLETQSRVTPVEKQKAAYDVKIQTYSKFQSLITDLGSKANALASLSSFSLFSETSSNEDQVTVQGGTGGVPGSYSVSVFHTATAEKLISAKGLVNDQTKSLFELGIGTGTISVDGVEIVIDDNDTIQDLRMKINSATTSEGDRVGTTATVIKASDTDYRLVLTATETGSSGVEYKDVSGSVLQTLGIITAADGSKGITNQSLTSVDDISAAFGALAAGSVITLAGADHDGNAVSMNFVKTAGSSVADFLAEVEKSFNGMVSASVDGSGRLVLNDSIGGHSQLGISSLTLGATTHAMQITTPGDSGNGVLTTGSDAYFSIDGLQLQSATNRAEGYIQGITLNLKKADPENPVTVEVGRDFDAIVEKIQALFTSYNSLVSFTATETKFANPDDKTSKKGTLAGDTTVGSVVTQFRALFQTQFTNAGSTYNGLSAFGLKTDTTNNQYSIDSKKLRTALETNFDDVVKLFTTSGSSTSTAVTYGRSTSSTTSGVYEMQEVGGAVQARLKGTSTWSDAGTRTGDIITFNNGPAEGMSVTLAPGSIPAGTMIELTFSKGMGDLVKGFSDTLVDTRDGLIAMRQQTFRKDITSANDRIERLNDSISRYRERLTKQFSAMEQSLSQLQSQTSNMLSALGSYS